MTKEHANVILAVKKRTFQTEMLPKSPGIFCLGVDPVFLPIFFKTVSKEDNHG